jgi:pre-mRNA-splicing factor ATP-dependent RNA helicase DHX16
MLMCHLFGLQEIERRKYRNDEEKEALVPMLRDISRQEYLKKREEQKLQELEDALKDEEYLFAVCCPSPP